MLLQIIHSLLNTNHGVFKNVKIVEYNGVFKNVKIAVSLKYLSNFWRSLETPLINYKIYLELNWTKDSVTSTVADATFKIINTKLYVQIVISKELLIGMSTKQK